MATQAYTKSNGYYVEEADIAINVSRPFATNGSSTAYDVGGIITHELGHLLGMGHELVDTDDTMYYSSSLGETKKRTLETGDESALTQIYGI